MFKCFFVPIFNENKMRISRIFFPCENEQIDDSGKCIRRSSYSCDECPHYKSETLSKLKSALRPDPPYLQYAWMTIGNNP